MTELDPITGLPRELSSWEDIAKEAQKIVVTTDKRRFGKVYTVVEGFDEREIDIKGLAKTLKAKLACGGTAKKGQIALQGNHKARVKEILVTAGFAAESIEVQ